MIGWFICDYKTYNRGEDEKKKKNYNQDLPKVTTSSAFNKSFW